MPTERLAMHQIKEIFRLRYVMELSVRAIARSLNISAGVVSEYLHLATRAEVS